jgi:TolA-binding protein
MAPPQLDMDKHLIPTIFFLPPNRTHPKAPPGKTILRSAQQRQISPEPLNNNQNIHNAKFQELEAQIKNHQREFKDIHARFDALNNQLLRNMNIASTHSAQFSQLERQFTSEMHSAIQLLLQRTTDSSHSNISPEAASTPQVASQIPNIEAPLPHHENHPTPTALSTPTTSQENKRIRQTNDDISSPESHLTNVQDLSAQYEVSTPAASGT